MMNFVFFTFRDFKREGGGTIRMYGVLNALAEKGEDVTLISNASDYSKFHPSIKHDFLNARVSSKSLFQALLALVPAWVVFILYDKVVHRVTSAVWKNTESYSRLFFFEYLDNSVGYLLKKTGKIASYYNDTHGIATIEFDYQRKDRSSLLQQVIFGLKYKVADRLDRKVFEAADGVVYSSKAMKLFFEQRYRLNKVKHFILPNLLSSAACETRIDYTLQEQLMKQLNISSGELIIFFAGGFKPTSGVDDLVKVFNELKIKYTRLRLILLGTGPVKDQVTQLVAQHNLGGSVTMLDNVPYEKLLTYQSLAHIIVCPDRHNEFSDMILHLKYLDSLVSGKVVINGSFRSVREVNVNESLSVNFKPSDLKDLYDKIEYSLLNYPLLTQRYQTTAAFVKENLTYAAHINILTD